MAQVDVTNDLTLTPFVANQPILAANYTTVFGEIISLFNGMLNDDQEHGVMTADPTGNPPTGTVFIYFKDVAGTVGLYMKEPNGAVTQLNGAGSGADEKAKVSANDTTAGYLNGKLVAGSNITLTENNNGGNETLTIAASGAGGGTVVPGTMQGRLTLSSTLPVPTADVTAATTVYLLPYKGNQAALYDGSSAWAYHAIPDAGVSASVPASTDTNYDVYLYDNGGTLTLDLVAWTNGTTRATALALQNGVYVKDGAAARLYVGTIRTTGVSGQCEDSETKRYVWNYYNPIRRKLKKVDTNDSWGYTTATWRSTDNSTANRVEFVVGVSEEAVFMRHVGFANSNTTSATGWAAVGISLDGTADSDADLMAGLGFNGASNSKTPLIAEYNGFPGIGYHYLQATELGAGGITFYGDNGATGNAQSGMMGHILG
jgi:hypothetical protein